jgi:hypothetical protein
VKSQTKKFVLYLLSRANANLYLSFDYSIRKLVAVKIKVICSYLLTRLTQGNMKKRLVGTKKYFQMGKGQVALLIANGPSALELDLHSIALARKSGSLKIFMVNFSLLTKEFSECGCDYLVLSDPNTRSTATNPRNIALWEIISNAQNLEVITPTSWHNDFGLIDCQLGDCLHFDDSSLESVSTNISPIRPRGYASLTAYKALAFACYMNFSQIYMCGIDNSLFRGIIVNENNHLIQKSNHLSPDYSQDSDLTTFFPNGMADYFFDTSVMFSSLKKCFGDKNIFNLGKNSEVDIFPKNCSDPLFESLRKI